MMTELLRKLNRLYGGQPVKEDVFGRRQALPSEIQAVIVSQNSDLVFNESIISQFPPTLNTLVEKEVHGRKNHGRVHDRRGR